MNFEISFLGLLVSLIFTALTGLYPGGIIIPSYLVLFIEQPGRIAGTLAAALLTAGCFKIASNYFILFGKRRFVFMIFLGGFWTFLSYQLFPYIFPLSPEFRVIGWVIPGLIANNIERQGFFITIASMVTVTVFVYFAGKFLLTFL